jgi:pimeloyl-ACP methyl ester carboxylesterase
VAEVRTTTLIETRLGPVELADSGGDGPVVLFVHGTPGGADQGALMGRFLVDAGFRVVAPSRPGYLGTPLSEATAEPGAQAALHAALLDVLGIDTFGLVCWSGGGPSSYELAASHPDRARAVVAIAALSGPYTFEHPGQEKPLFTRPGAWLMREMARHAPKSVVKAMTTEEGDLDRQQAKDLVAATWEDEDRRRFVLDWVETVIGRRSEGFDNDRARYPNLDLPLERVTAPVLLVHADTDSDVPVSHSHHAAERLPRATLRIISGGTHISAWAGPDEVATQAAVVEHLRG